MKNRSRLANVMPPEVINWLEERDRELEHWLRTVATNSVSITAVSQAIWTPALHASTHAVAGSDPVSPSSIGAYTTAQVDTLNNSQDALFWMNAAHDDAPAVAQDLLAEQAWRIMESDGPATITYPPAAATTVDGHIIVDEVTDVTPQRARLAFRGAGVTAADTGVRTAVDIPGKAVEDEGVAVTYRDTLNFVGAAVAVTDVASKTTVTITEPAAATAQSKADDTEALMWMLVNP